MAYSWNDPDTRDLWTLTIDESALLPGMTDKGRLGFAAQLKFMQLQGRFPERHDEIDPNAAQWLAAQLGTTTEALSSYELCGRQGQRHRRTIRDFLGFRRATGADLQQLVQWLCDDVFPFDPQARHGHDMALDWCRTQRLEPRAGDHLDRVIRSAAHGYETRQQAAIHSRMKHIIAAIFISATSAYSAVAGAQYGSDFSVQQRMLQQQQQMQQQMSQQQIEQHQMQEQMLQQKALQHKMEQQMQQQSLDRMYQQQRRDNMR